MYLCHFAMNPKKLDETEQFLIFGMAIRLISTQYLYEKMIETSPFSVYNVSQKFRLLVHQFLPFLEIIQQQNPWLIGKTRGLVVVVVVIDDVQQN